MAWFEICRDKIYAKDHLSGTQWGMTEVWGMYVGKWCLDYTWKLMFHIDEDTWNNRCNNLKTDEDFYDFCEWLGVYYMGNDNKIHRQGHIYDAFGTQLD